MPLISLVYVSFATYQMSDRELRDLLQVCREKNKEKALTGMLLYHDGFFIQALEGEENVVHEIYEKIGKDPRHNRILTVYRNLINERAFGNWEMGYNPISIADGQGIDGFSSFMAKPDPEFFAKHPSKAAVLLQSFRDRTYF